jgi:hypothetical protein
MRLDPVDINVVQVCPRTGRTLHSKRHTATALSYCVAETDSAASHGRKVLVIGREEKTQQEFAIAGGVRVLARHAASEGKATIMLTQRNLQIMCQAEPNAMVGWLRGIADPAAAAAARTSQQPPPPVPAPTKRVLAPLSPNCMSPTAAARLQPKKGREPGRSPLQAASEAKAAQMAAVRPLQSARTAGHAPSPLVALSPATAQKLTTEQQAVMRDVLGGKSVCLIGGASNILSLRATDPL